MREKLKNIFMPENEDFRNVFSLYEIKNMFGKMTTGIRSDRNMIRDVTKMVKDIPNHSAFRYINKDTIDEEYFKTTEKTLDNGYLYIILSSTGSPAGETIRKLTRKEYSHTSISFDEELKTIISYNGGNNLYSPGLNMEELRFFYQKEDANIMIYRIRATKEQKEKILNEIKRINEEGSAYNMLGLIMSYSHKDNIMICSQFVYTILKGAELNYFEKKPEKVRPMDFIELNYEGKLEYCSKVFIKDVL